MTVAIIIVILLFLNGVFVAAEFAIVSVPLTTLQKRSQQGNTMAKQALSVRQSPDLQDQYIATAQLGITLASLGLGMYGEHHLAEWLYHFFHEISWLEVLAVHSIATAISVALLTYFHVVLGEMIPKSLALQKSERMVLLLTPLMLGFRWLFFPLVWGLNGLGNGLLALLRVDRGSEHLSTSIRDIQFAVFQSQEAGVLDKDAAEVLLELLAFTHKDARHLMVPRMRMAALAQDSDVETIRKTLMKSAHARYPVYGETLDDILGFVHIKDLYKLLKQSRYKQPLFKVPLRPLPLLPASSDLETVFQSMFKENAHMVMLLDEMGGTDGLMTLGDILTSLVGPIDVHDLVEAEIQPQPDGSIWIAGTLRLEELGEHLGLDLDHDVVETISGLILDILERPPEVGDQVVYEGIHFRVMRLQGRGVERCEIRLQTLDSAES